MKTIVLTIGDIDLSFNPTEADYGEYMSEVAQGDFVNASHNFVMSIVDEESKDALREITKENPGAAMQITGEVLKEYTPKLQIKVKK
ncbi:putative phage tail assembly chaperone [Vibrio vulnificus]|nr:putative phage tail assembly chaperone [Vibrio vulnificus]EID0715073.1 putative phage tail assembly chaperone [Vibrio vulnificus]EID0739246.1 putative phage tail assembly chaperone [Vibrio vulnificus]EJL7816746.1 putative phage tail assembly chaperone [Vibrio vulnificus]